MTKTPWYIDTTLRDGEQAPGIAFSPTEKITIATLLEVCGIDEVELGTPAMGRTEQETMRTISQQGFRFRTSSWCRAVKKDIDDAIRTGTAGVNISFPVSQVQLTAMGKSESWVMESIPEIVRYAQDYFEYVSLGAQDASRADFNFLSSYMSLAALLGVHRVRIADTIGCQNPFSAHSLISRLAHAVPEMPMEYHAHNDLGMATANTISAIAAGAAAVSTTINGIGERAGNASLDEVVMACRKTLGATDKLNTRFLPHIASYVETASGRPLSESKPITGRSVLKHESGIHTNALLKDPGTYQLLDGREFGKNHPEIVFGKHSGTNAILHFFETRGIRPDQEILSGILEQIRLFAQIKKNTIREEELLDMYYRMS
ncbi:MAG: pyruvate carboxyltransferase [Bacteroidales bacterium]|nr:pyruvate carboxyltransferase [Bacteroidales bacterium]